MGDYVKEVRSRQEEADAELTRIQTLSDEDAWVEAAKDFTACKTPAEVFQVMVISLCAQTDVTFFREFRVQKRKVINVHYRKFEGGSFQSALARCWLWSRWVVRTFDGKAG